MVYTSLTAIPRNVKEGIDWLVALKGDDPAKNLKAISEAVYNFLADKPVGKLDLPALEKAKLISKGFLRRQVLNDQPFVKELLGKFNGSIHKEYYKYLSFVYDIAESEYENIIESRGETAETVEDNITKVVHATEMFLDDVKNSDKYTSAYTPEATWNASCSKDPEVCAMVFVGIAPMLYTGLRFLKDTCTSAILEGERSMGEKRLGSVLEALGYNEQLRRSKMGGSDLNKALSGVDKDVLDIIYDFAGFWAFY
ncbi:hypothetical protein BBBOND_0101230 [Babesia bigemina]|uniref:Uncharacterized protein n=1 Tax=Babesia bigemina TaxID=5866 RepID=A0A061D4E1_BABBI|nr:hypothetical protein BBBOND_0101230 [Babesia bigemina]CDR93794.1 hypothetical protein BBBOND_0101230 [Babesia bigemina]|eukprot:XP_012765980.1 hypothetical protein BBBOND_0101230 [Babesia bigemina]